MFFQLLTAAAVVSATVAEHSATEPTETFISAPAERTEKIFHRTDSLRAATIVADKGMVVSITDSIPINGTFNAADLLQMIPGVSVSDYGGYSGLKTAGIRGMGSSQTAIYIDGVRWNNVQTGQADLGLMGMENYGTAVIDYSQNSISFLSAQPHFYDGRIVSGDFRLDGGSFGTILPYGKLNFRLSDKVVFSGNASGVISKGDWPCLDGSRRGNNDISLYRCGVDLRGATAGGIWHMKAGFNSSKRGIPGSITYPSTDRQNDRNAFVQGTARQSFGRVYSLTASAKASLDLMDYLSEWGNNSYSLSDVQLNTGHFFRIFDWWRMSLAADFQWDRLKSDLYEAERSSIFTAIATNFSFERVRIDVTAEYYLAKDRGGSLHQALSPSIGLKWTVTDGLALTATGRRAYRTPTFNELFYPGFGNKELRPEDAWLTDIGFDYRLPFMQRHSFRAKIHGFYNYLTDKIISAPTADNPYVWLPYNIGRVQAAGIDSGIGFNLRFGELSINLDAAYSWQHAVDKTPGSSSYGTQIPFVARHTATACGRAEWRGWSLAAVWNIRSGRSDSSGKIPDWNTADLSIGKRIDLPHGCPLTLSLQLKNINDSYYETVRDYPMPGLGFYGGVSFSF